MSDRRRAAGLSVIGAIAAVACGFLVTLVGALTDSVRVTSEEQLRGPLEFGFPFPWVTQWTTLDPPLPYRVSIGSPLETPTDAHWDIFWLDVALMTAVVGLIVLGVPRLRRAVERHRQQPDGPPSTRGTYAVKRHDADN